MKACASFGELVAAYLSPAHRDDPGGGCALAALGSDIARQGPKVRRRLTDHVRLSIERIAGRRPGSAFGSMSAVSFSVQSGRDKREEAASPFTTAAIGFQSQETITEDA